MFSEHSGMKVELNYKKKTEKFTNTLRLNNMLLNSQCFKEEVKEKFKKCSDK